MAPHGTNTDASGMMEDSLSHAPPPPPLHAAVVSSSERSHSLRSLRISSRSQLGEPVGGLHSRIHQLTKNDMLLQPEQETFVQLERAAHAPGVAATTAQSLRIGCARLQRAVLRAGRSSVPEDGAVSALSKRLTTSVATTTSFYKANLVVLYKEVLCGIAAVLLMIPEAIAFSYVANLDPIQGLYATGFFGLLIGFLGGVPSTVAGAAGAVAVVMPQLTSATGTLSDLTYEQRLEHLFVAVFLAGCFQLLFGIFELSRFFSMIPRTAHIGFLNGLAIMMFISQRTTFEVCKLDGIHFGLCEQRGELQWMSARDATTWTTAFTVLLTIVVMVLWPRVPRVGRLIPPTLISAVVAIGFEFGINRPLLGYNVRTIGDTSPLAGSLPSFHVPHFGSVANWAAVLSCAASIAMVGIFESIMTLQAVVDLNKTHLTRSACRRECAANGIANMVCGLFSAMGGCSMIGQSTGNVLNGAKHRLSTVVMGIMVFMVILVGSSIIECVPVACLTGILLVIIYHTFYWPSLQLIFRLKVTDAVAIILVTALAAAINLAVAVIAGVIWQSLVNGWTSGQQLFCRSSFEALEIVELDEDAAESGQRETHQVDARVYHVRGTLLYSSVAAFRSFFHFEEDPEVVVVDLRDCHFADFSAVAALKEAATRYHEHGKTLAARHLDQHAIDLVLHRDMGWELVDQVLVLKRPTTDPDVVGHTPRSPFRSMSGILSPRSPQIAAPYHVIQG